MGLLICHQPIVALQQGIDLTEKSFAMNHTSGSFSDFGGRNRDVRLPPVSDH